MTASVRKAIRFVEDTILKDSEVGWTGFYDWFNRLRTSNERVVGHSGTAELVERRVDFYHHNAQVAQVLLEGLYPIDEAGARTSDFACWDVKWYAYARRYVPGVGASGWRNVNRISHNGATVLMR